MFEQDPWLLSGVGRDGDIAPVEEYVSVLFSAQYTFGEVSQARHNMFQKVQTEIEKLPPSKAALLLH